MNKILIWNLIYLSRVKKTLIEFNLWWIRVNDLVSVVISISIDFELSYLAVKTAVDADLRCLSFNIIVTKHVPLIKNSVQCRWLTLLIDWWSKVIFVTSAKEEFWLNVSQKRIDESILQYFLIQFVIFITFDS